MNNKYIVFLIFLISSVSVTAQMSSQDFSSEISAQAIGGYSNTWNYYSGLDLKGSLHVRNIDLCINVETLSKNTYSLGFTVSPYMMLNDKAKLFMDGTLHSRLFTSYRTYEFVYAFSFGLKMRHFSAQVGLFSRAIDDMDRQWHDTDNYVAEPFNLLYRVVISIMGFDNGWDIFLSGSDFNEFEYERMWEPILSLGGRYDINDKISAVAECTLKPSGMFHLVASFYSVWMKAGITYKF
ncbi:MAG: hypothetical protein ACI358_06775 [Candidatus Limimorpha sp.]